MKVSQAVGMGNGTNFNSSGSRARDNGAQAAGLWDISEPAHEKLGTMQTFGL